MKKIFIEIADTPQSREKGLMFRKSLGKDDGMLFKFPYKNNLQFWMKSTYIPLDIAFIDDNGEIFQIESMYPLSTKRVSSRKPCRYALEMNQNWFENNNVTIGSCIKNLNITDKRRLIAQNEIVENIDPSQIEESNEIDISPDVQLNLGFKEKVKYANDHQLALQIVYKSEQSGKVLPPRKLYPISKYSRQGRYGDYLISNSSFKAEDVSATIDGGDWVIIGEGEGYGNYINPVKEFLFENILSLEVLDEFVNI